MLKVESSAAAHARHTYASLSDQHAYFTFYVASKAYMLSLQVAFKRGLLFRVDTSITVRMTKLHMMSPCSSKMSKIWHLV
jgi:hypothetical protein